MSIIIIALSMAFCWVEFIQPTTAAIIFILTGNRLLDNKPFNCVKCLTGWISLIIGVYYFGWLGLVYLPLGVFTGAIFSAIQMRWL
ncbi:MAG: hypothetical protein WCP46_00905 [Alphaproteobacteria bacterium]